MERLIDNVYYFRVISAIGGVEQFLCEIAKKYGESTDIVIYYDRADNEQLKRLQKYVKCVKYEKGKKVRCKKFFANFNLEMVQDVEAEVYYFVIHANFEELGYKPDLSILDGLNAKYIAVSEFAKREFEKFTGKKCEVSYNPLTIEPKEEVIHIVSACRLDDKVKGGARTLKLIEALDKYAKEHNRHYLWHIFTNNINYQIESKNVCLMQRRVDVRPFIQDSDYCIQLSNDMETYCYTLCEALSYGIHTISTPLSVLKEFNIPEGANKILEWDCSNVDEVARYIFENKREHFEWNAPEDNWKNLFIKGKSFYQEELKRMYRVRATDKFKPTTDNDVQRTREEGEEWIVNYERLQALLSINGIIEVVEEIKEEAIQKPKVKKAVRKNAKQ